MAKVVVVGGGISGLSASIYLARNGYEVDLIEKELTLGGRANLLIKDGFKFDTGPSWYWMPDVFDRVFQDWGYNLNDFLSLKRLDPNYQIVWPYEFVKKNGLPSIFNEITDRLSFRIPAGLDAFLALANKLDPENRLDEFFQEAERRYQLGMHDFCLRPSVSVREFCSLDDLQKIGSLDLFTNYRAYVGKYTDNPILKRILEFGVLFLGQTPDKMPAMYSMMAYADIALGTWYPEGGMYKIIEALEFIAKESGVKIYLGHSVNKLSLSKRILTEVECTNGHKFKSDIVVNGTDYSFFESLLPRESRRYSNRYWRKRTTSPSALIFYLGVKGRLNKLLHHNLFFDVDVDEHMERVHSDKQIDNPAFYLCTPSLSDPSVAPAGCENLFILIPLSGKAAYDKEQLYRNVISRIENFCSHSIDVVVREDFTPEDFEYKFNSLHRNAYGLSNSLNQTAIFKPKIVSSKIDNLYHVGQTTVPGGGLPPCLLSGKVVTSYIASRSG